ncbi:MAG TPA: FkbM family methyltransferase [Rudaea sp.]|nr:FkbM family methyltransferase [Rudaea sp.]
MMRRLAYRLGRKLYAWGRGETANNPSANGEYWLVDKAVPLVDDGAVFLDIGANRGEWTRYVLEAASTAGKPLRVIDFEPCSGTRQLLDERFAAERRVEIVPTALSAESGTATMFSTGAGAGTNSLHRSSGPQAETVSVTTLDGFLGERGLARIAFAKIDTEGYDALVLRGARASLGNGVFDLVQFEYNWRWLFTATSLRSVFELIEGTPYRLGRLSGAGLLLFDGWHFELDRFFEGNYVLVRRGSPIEALGTTGWFDKCNILRW